MMKAYSLFDSKAACFSPPFFVPTDGIAMRTFSEIASDPSTRVYKYAEDFSLFHIGDFDDSTGVLIPVTLPRNMATASSVKVVSRGVVKDYISYPNGKSEVVEVK